MQLSSDQADLKCEECQMLLHLRLKVLQLVLVSPSEETKEVATQKPTLQGKDITPH